MFSIKLFPHKNYTVACISCTQVFGNGQRNAQTPLGDAEPNKPGYYSDKVSLIQL